MPDVSDLGIKQSIPVSQPDLGIKASYPVSGDLGIKQSVPIGPTISERPYLPAPNQFPRSKPPLPNEFTQDAVAAKAKMDEAARAPLTTGEASAVALGTGLADLAVAAVQPKNIALAAGLTALTAFPPTAPIGIGLTAGLGAKQLGEAAGTAESALEAGDIPTAVGQLPNIAASGLMVAGAPKSLFDRLTPKTASAAETVSNQTKGGELLNAKEKGNQEEGLLTPKRPTLESADSGVAPPPIVPRETAISVGPGAASPAEFAPVKPNITGIRNAVTDIERQNRGLPPVEPVAKRDFGTVWDDALKKIDQTPEYQDQLIQELRDSPRAATDTEVAVILQRQIDLQNEFDKAQRAVVEAYESGDQDAQVEAYQRFNSFSDQLLEIYDIGKAFGTETSRGLNARRMMANENFSLAAMITEKRAANNGRPLTDAEVSELQTLKEKLDATQKAFDEYKANAEQRAAETASAETVDAIKKQASGKTASTATPDTITARIKAAAGQNAPLEELGGLIQKLAKAFVVAGIKERDPLIDAVHGVIKDIIPDLTRRDTMDAISGYGKFKQLSQAEADVQLRQLKGEMQQVGKIEDMQAGVAPKKTGVERRTPSTEERTLIKKVNEMKKKLGFTVTDPATQLRSALDSIKTRLRNQITDLELQISSKTKIVKDKTAPPTDAEADLLRAKRDDLKQEFDSIFGSPELTDAQRIERATKTVERSIDEYERQLRENAPASQKKAAANSPELEALRARREGLRQLLQLFRDSDPVKQEQASVNALFRSIDEYERRIQEKDFQTERPEQQSTPKLEALRKRRDELAKQFRDLKAATPEVKAEAIQKATDSVQASIDELVRQINEGDIAPKSSEPKATSPELEALRGERADLLKVKRDLQNALKPHKTPEEIALQSFKTRTANRIADLQEKIANGDFTTPDRKPIQFDEEALKLRAANERLKKEFRAGVERDRLANRGKLERAEDWWVKWRRANVLSGFSTLGKLTAAAVQRMAFTPIEEAIGAGIGKVFPRLEKAARMEGRLRIRAEAKSFTEALTAGMRDAYDTLRTGQSSLDVVYGKTRLMEPSAIEFFGHLHGALKAPVKRAAFARFVEKLTQADIERGIDVTDPMVQTKNALAAYRQAQRSIFLQDNRVVSAYQSALRTLEQKKGETGQPSKAGKAGATIARTLLPIVRVPVNFVAETFEYSTGLTTGLTRLGLIARRGMDTMTEAEANLIMRQLKKGSIGQAFMLLGYLNPEVIGGYYQRGQKREPGDVKYGSIKLYGVSVPSILLHSALIEQLQIGATIRRVADSKLRKKDAEPQGIGPGLMAGALGLTEEVPFVREMAEVSKAYDPSSRGAFFGELSKGLLVPQLVQQLARFMDNKDEEGEPVKRNPQSVLEHIETGVPGLRQTVPEKPEPKKKLNTFSIRK